VGMVTNAMVLEKTLSRRLIDAGLRAITFSLDGVDPAATSRGHGDPRRRRRRGLGGRAGDHGAAGA